MDRIGFGWYAPAFSGINDAHIEFPCYERFDYPLTRKTAILCEKLGYDSVWVCDHLTMGDRGEVAECWTLLSALAAVTSRIRLGTYVLCDAHRNPALVAKMAATLDNISSGRLEYGIGAGWSEFEQVSYGLPWLGKPIERIRRMEEGIEIVKRMWTEERPVFEGKYYRIKEPICYPKPVQKPHPPIWVAGQGERILRSVAKYADAWNYFWKPVEEHAKLIAMLRTHCQGLGRDSNEITASWGGSVLVAKNEADLKKKVDAVHRLSPHHPLSLEKRITEIPAHPFLRGAPVGTVDWRASALVGTPEQVTDRVQQYVDIGVKRFILSFLDFPSTEGIELFAERVMPALW